MNSSREPVPPMRTHHAVDTWADHLTAHATDMAPVVDAILDTVVAEMSTPPRTILDLGSGTGAATVALARRFADAEVHAVDVEPVLLDRVETSAATAGVGSRVHRHLTDASTELSAVLPARVDLIWAAQSLHHVSDPAAMLRQLFEVLAPGGLMVVIEPAEVDRRGRRGDVVGAPADHDHRHSDAHRVQPLHRDVDWAALLHAAGFSMIWTGRHELGPRADDESSAATNSQLNVWIVEPSASGTDALRSERAEVVVIGGGAAGLAAATALARSRRRVVLIDAGQNRNSVAEGAHNVLGHDGIAPAELLARGRAEAQAYGAVIVSGTATNVLGGIDDFTVEVDGGVSRVHARRVVLATGLVDDLPDIPGIGEGWGRSVLHCPFCHGWEVRDRKIAIIARGEIPMHQAMLFGRLSDQITVFGNDAPEPTAAQQHQLDALGASLIGSRVVEVRERDGQVESVVVEDGQVVDVDAVVVVPRFHARTELFEKLGGVAAQTPFGRQIPTDERGMTEVPGVWAAGNAGDMMAMIMASAAAGLTAGAGVHGELSMADLEQAVQQRI